MWAIIKIVKPINPKASEPALTIIFSLSLLIPVLVSISPDSPGSFFPRPCNLPVI